MYKFFTLNKTTKNLFFIVERTIDLMWGDSDGPLVFNDNELVGVVNFNFP